MNNVKVFGRRGSDFRKHVNDWMGNHRIRESHMAVNYGLQGEDLIAYGLRNTAINNIPVLNHKQAGNKYEQISAVQGMDEVVPRSCSLVLIGGAKPYEHCIAKPFYSLGGRDIFRVENLADVNPDTHYLQEEVTNRRYEMRVHAFAWIDEQQWLFQKRVHDDGDEVLAWNHHNGGRFITIEDPHDALHDRIRASVKVIMKRLGYQFGAVDFIIKNPGQRGEQLQHYFLEWNLAPGWTLDRTRDYYKDSFSALKEVQMDLVEAMCIDGIYPWEIELDRDDMPGDDGVFDPLLHPIADAVIDPAAIARARGIIENDFVEEDMAELEEMAEDLDDQDNHVNFCPRCGAVVTAPVFDLVPLYCTQCGQRVRAA
jgi:hypothetical protein